QDCPGVAIQGMAGRSRHHTLAAADEELLAELGLECGYMLAECWLRDEEELSRASDRASIDDGDEILQPACLHVGILRVIDVPREPVGRDSVPLHQLSCVSAAWMRWSAACSTSSLVA